jgi:hypothetical protein
MPAKKEQKPVKLEKPKKPGYVEGTGVPTEAAHETPQSKLAKGILSACDERMTRGEARARSFLERASSSPEGAASSLEEIAAMYAEAASYFGARAAVLRYGPGEANPILSVSARNVRNSLLLAAEQLAEAPHTPKSWAAASERCSEAQKTIKAVETVLMGQGISLVAREDVPLRGPDGKSLLEA